MEETFDAFIVRGAFIVSVEPRILLLIVRLSARTLFSTKIATLLLFVSLPIPFRVTAPAFIGLVLSSFPTITFPLKMFDSLFRETFLPVPAAIVVVPVTETRPESVVSCQISGNQPQMSLK